MKKNISLLAAASLLLLAFSSSCSKEEKSSANGKTDVNEGEVSTGTSSSIITATYGDADADITKVAFATTDGTFTWSEVDRIAIYDSDGNVDVGTLESGAGTGSGTFTAELAQGDRAGYAVYPHYAAAGYDGSTSTLKIKYPSSYTIDNTIADWKNYYATYSPTPMIATNAANSALEFFHVGGLFRITLLSVPSGTASIKVVFPVGVTGTFSMSSPTPGSTSIATTSVSGSNNVITYTFTNALTSSLSYLILNVPVPTCGYASYYAGMYDSNGALLSLCANGTAIDRTILRAQGRKVTPKKMETPDNFGGPFTISDVHYYLSSGDLYLKTVGTSFATATFDLYTDPFYSVTNNYGMTASSYATQEANTAGRSYFNWLELGTLFSTAAVSTSTTTNIDNLKVPTGIASGCKVPTQTQYAALTTTAGRTGSTVNGTSACRFAKVAVSSASSSYPNALVLFPDGVVITISESLTFNTTNGAFTSISEPTYETLIAAGCVFLPAAGTYFSNVRSWYYRGSNGLYWSSTARSNSDAYGLYFYGSSVGPSDSSSKSYSFFPVRLLQES